MNGSAFYGNSQYNTLIGVKPPITSTSATTIVQPSICKDDLLGQAEPENGRYRNNPTGRLGVGVHRIKGYEGVSNWDKQTGREYEEARRQEKENEMKRELAKNLRKEVENELEAEPEKAEALAKSNRDKSTASALPQSQKELGLKQGLNRKDSVTKRGTSAVEDNIQKSNEKSSIVKTEVSTTTKRQRTTGSSEPATGRNGHSVQAEAPSTPVPSIVSKPKPARVQHSSPRSASKVQHSRKRRCIAHTKSHKTCPDDCPNPRE